MRVTVPEKVAGAQDALFVLEVEFPVATTERVVEVKTSSRIEALDLSGSGRGGTYRIPVGLERLHVPMRVVDEGAGDATVAVSCTQGPEAGLTETLSLVVETPQTDAAEGRRRWTLGALAVLAVALGAWFIARNTGDKVPSVIEMTQAEAEGVLQAAKFDVLITHAKAGEDVQPGHVYAQKPEGGTKAESDRIVEIFVAHGSADQRAVPSVVGMLEVAAREVLEGTGFEVWISPEETTDPSRAGTVLRQVPDGMSRLARGGKVEIFVAESTEGVVVPDVVGELRPDAEDALARLGLQVELSLETTSVVSAHEKVSAQDPAGGMTVEPGSTVFLTVAQRTLDTPGPSEEPRPIAMVPDETEPPMETLPPDETEPPTETLPPTEEPGTQPAVAEPTGPAAIEVGPDGRLTLPDMVGWQGDDAQQALRDAGLNPVVTLFRPDDASQSGQVVTQRPAGGSEVSMGRIVMLTVAEKVEGAPEPTDPPVIAEPPIETEPPVVPTLPGPDETAPPFSTEPTMRRIEVPDVVGLMEAEALLLLEEAGLRGEIQPRETEYPPAGTVLMQEPLAAEQADEGSQVLLEVARTPPGAAPVEVEPARVTTEPESPEPSQPVVPEPFVPEPSAPPTELEPVVPAPVAMREPQVGEVRAVNPSPRTGPLPPVRLPPRSAPRTQTVPTVAGVGAEDAITRVLIQGLIPIVDMDRQGTAPASRVLASSPMSGERLLPGDLVRLRVSAPSREGERTVWLPMAVGAEVSKAQRMFGATRTGVRVLEIKVPGHPYAGTGRVAAQYPVSAVPASDAARVTLWIVAE